MLFLTNARFIDELKAMEALDKREPMRYLYTHIYALFEEKAYRKIDEIIAGFIEKGFGIQLCVALLTITYSKRDKLDVGLREKLLVMAKKQGLSEGFNEAQITKTLAGF